MKKKLRDMVVGDKFIGIYSGKEMTVVFVSKDMILSDSGSGIFGVDRYVRCTDLYQYREMVEPEPEWLYECIDNYTYYVFFKRKTVIDVNNNLSIINGGRKMHPDTFKIVD